jgi:hypothetical protein
VTTPLRTGPGGGGAAPAPRPLVFSRPITGGRADTGGPSPGPARADERAGPATPGRGPLATSQAIRRRSDADDDDDDEEDDHRCVEGILHVVVLGSERARACGDVSPSLYQIVWCDTLVCIRCVAGELLAATLVGDPAQPAAWRRARLAVPVAACSTSTRVRRCVGASCRAGSTSAQRAGCRSACRRVASRAVPVTCTHVLVCDSCLWACRWSKKFFRVIVHTEVSRVVTEDSSWIDSRVCVVSCRAVPCHVVSCRVVSSVIGCCQSVAPCVYVCAPVIVLGGTTHSFVCVPQAPVKLEEYVKAAWLLYYKDER